MKAFTAAARFRARRAARWKRHENRRRLGYSVAAPKTVTAMKSRLVPIIVLLGLAGCVVAPAPPPYATLPAPRAEIVPPPPGPAPKWVWQPGGWHWNGAQYVWLPGHYVERLPTYTRWEPGHWIERGGNWEWVPGRWV